MKKYRVTYFLENKDKSGLTLFKKKVEERKEDTIIASTFCEVRQKIREKHGKLAKKINVEEVL